MYGRPSQQFYLDNNNKIVSVKCPELAISSISDGRKSQTDLQLSSQGSRQYYGKYQTIKNRLFRHAHINWNLVVKQYCGARNYNKVLSAKIPSFDNNTETGVVTKTAIAPPKKGAERILLNNAAEQSQFWIEKHERIQNLKGPLTLVIYKSG